MATIADVKSQGVVAGVGWRTLLALGVAALAALILGSSPLAVLKEWMIRSYVVTLGFVTFRVLFTVLQMAKVFGARAS